ncbi:MAG: hypothetical protein LBQ31_02920 [Bacteroidales bacterium]|jgi:hypothetical protein|nr:hypothetical protein [Bacteroidales bacterium]
MQLDFKIDKLTHSIENAKTGDSFRTNVLPITKNDLRQITKSNGWKFDWKAEISPINEVYKLIIEHNTTIIQGLISLSIERDYVFVNLLENAPFNVGKNKMYQGVAGNLMAYACQISFLHEFEGYVAFEAKTKLIEHYKGSLGAIHVGNQRMIIQSKEALWLVNKYFYNLLNR